MRRLPEDERPLPLCLSWSSEGLDAKRFVLQENDTGEIIVSAGARVTLRLLCCWVNESKRAYYLDANIKIEQPGPGTWVWVTHGLAPGGRPLNNALKIAH